MPSTVTCRNCNSSVKPEDVYCSHCGKKLSDVGRAFKVELFDRISLTDKKRLSQEISSSIVTVASDASTTGSLIKAIPSEEREAIGINEDFIRNFSELQQRVQNLQKQPFLVDLHETTINGPLYLAQGDNIALSFNIDDSFNKLIQEIEKSDVTPEIKVTAKSKAVELKAEITKEN